MPEKIISTTYYHKSEILKRYRKQERKELVLISGKYNTLDVVAPSGHVIETFQYVRGCGWMKVATYKGRRNV